MCKEGAIKQASLSNPGWRVIVPFLLLMGGVATFGCIRWIKEASRKEHERAVLGMINDIQRQGHAAKIKERERYWTLDVAGLHELGVISREVAEADVKPLVKRVDQPRPYHGYLLVAMASAMDMSGGDTPVVINDQIPAQRTFGFCVFPSSMDQQDARTYLISPVEVFRSRKPCGMLLSWPEQAELRTHWQRYQHFIP